MRMSDAEGETASRMRRVIPSSIRKFCPKLFFAFTKVVESEQLKATGIPNAGEPSDSSRENTNGSTQTPPADRFRCSPTPLPGGAAQSPSRSHEDHCRRLR